MTRARLGTPSSRPRRSIPASPPIPSARSWARWITSRCCAPRETSRRP